MDIATLAPIDISKLTEEELEGALCLLREKGGNGKNGKKGKKGKGGKDTRKTGKTGTGTKIAGNCWNCDKPGPYIARLPPAPSWRT